MRPMLATIVIVVLAAACTSVEGETTATTDDAQTTTSELPGDETTSTSADETASRGADDSSSADSVETDCPENHFLLEANEYVSPQGYTSPELSVTCTEDTVIIESNGMINYEFVQITPNELEAQDLAFELPLEPTPAEEPLAMGLGTTGVAVNGAVIFAAFEAPEHGYGDPLSDGLLDYCNGHTAQGGIYHYHARMDCLFEENELANLVYGYSLDGYPILSPYRCSNDDCVDIEELSSSYVRVDPDGTGAFEAWEYREGAGDLDECNGMVGDDGEYRYYATDTFPYVPFCYHGETDAAVGVFDGTAPAGAGPGGRR